MRPSRERAQYDHFCELVEQARNLVEAHEQRGSGWLRLTKSERQELAVLRIRLDDYDEVANA